MVVMLLAMMFFGTFFSKSLPPMQSITRLGLCFFNSDLSLASVCLVFSPGTPALITGWWMSSARMLG